jgi:hypothetical protein
MLVGGRFTARLAIVKLFNRHSALNISDKIAHSPSATLQSVRRPVSCPFTSFNDSLSLVATAIRKVVLIRTVGSAPNTELVGATGELIEGGIGNSRSSSARSHS